MDKLIKTLIAVLFAVGIAFQTYASSPTIKHIVKKNETISSIAERYDVSESQILELNPDAAQMMYVGMELIVPVVSTSSTAPTKEQTQKSNNVATNQSSTTTTTTTTNYEDTFKPGWDFGAQYILELPKHNLAWEVSLLGLYRFTESAYCGVGAGYMNTNYSYEHYEVTFHYITVPFELGYRIGSQSFSIVPNVGVNLNLAVSKKSKYKNDEYDIDGGSFGINGKIGAKFMFKGLSIGAAYYIPLNDDMKMSVGKDGYVGFSLGIGI